MHLTFYNVNDAFTWLVSGIQKGLEIPDQPLGVLAPPTIPTHSSPSRYGPVHRISGGPVTLTYLYPCQRVLWNAERDCNPFFHLFECIWMLAGRNDIAPLVYFNKKYAEFSDDGKTAWGAYGSRWKFGPAIGDWDERATMINQIQTAIDILRVDPRSRRVVLQMWEAKDLERVRHSPDCKDVPCNTEILLDIRNGLTAPAPDSPSQCLPIVGYGPTKPYLSDIQGQGHQLQFSPKKRANAGKHRGSVSGDEHQINQFLDMTVINRSNDMVWGCLGANYVHMSFLQEYIACALGVRVGLYHQVTNNLHIYENNWSPDKWLSNLQPDPYMSRHDPYPNPPIFVFNTAFPQHQTLFDNDVRSLFVEWDQHQSFRLMDSLLFNTPFFADVVKPLIQSWNMHLARRYIEAILIAERITHADWRLACKQWLQRRQISYENRSRQNLQLGGQQAETSDASHSEIPPK